MEENKKKILDVDRFMLESYVILCDNYMLISAYIEEEYFDDDNIKKYLQNMLECIDDLIKCIETGYKEPIVSFNEAYTIRTITSRPIYYTLQGLFDWISLIQEEYRPDSNASKDMLLMDLQNIISKVNRIQSVSKTVSETICDSDKGIYEYYDNNATETVEPDKLAYIVAKNISTSWINWDNGISPSASVCLKSIAIMKLFQEMYPPIEWQNL